MSTTVDERVVSMEFDNRHFEKNVQTSLGTLDKLKQSLNLTGATKGLENVESAAKGVNMSPLSNAVDTVGVRFSALQIAAATALSNITNSAVNAGKRIVSALTIDPIKSGFSEYETQMGAIQTILANTESKGSTLKDVNSALDELNTYADKTIYNFTEMTRNIGTFTAAGVDLDTSVSAIKGIANLAAVSGSTSQQASTAMYQLSQAMASGTVKLMDWNSVVNAGMGGQIFQDALKETAKVHGVAIDDIIKKQGSFRESLSEGWLTSEILTDTLAKFTGDLSKEQLKAQGYTDKQIEDIMKLGQTANDAATKVKTFTQLFDTLKEAAQSGWSQTWKILVGDFEEAKEMLTQVSDTLGGMIGASAESRNELLENWKVLGGRQDVIDSVKNAFEGLMDIIKPISEAFREIFPPITAEQLKGFTEGLKNLTAKMKLSDTASENLKRTFKGIFAIFGIVKQLFVAVAKAVGSLFGTVGELTGGVLGLTGSVGDWLTRLHDAIRDSDIFNKVLQGIVSVIKAAFKGVSAFANFIKGKIVSPGMELFQGLLEKVAENMTGVGDTAGVMRDGVVSAFDAMASAIEGSTFFKLIGTLWNGIIKLGSGIVNALGTVIGTIIGKLTSGNFSGLLDLVNAIVSGGVGIGLIKFIKSLTTPLDNLGGFLDGITGILDGVRGCFEAYQQQLQAGALMKIATAIAILAASLLVLAFIDADKLGTAIGAISALFAELLVAMSIVTKLNGKKGLFGITTAIVGISAGMLILAAAMKIMSTMSWSEMGVGLISLASGLGLMVAAVNLLPEKKVNKAASAIKKLASAMLILAVAIKIMSTMSWSEMGVGLITMATGLGLMVAAVNLLPTNKVSSAASAIGKISFAMLILAAAIKIMSTMSWTEMGIGLTAMVAGLAALVLAVHALPKDTAIRALGMVSLATSLVILAGALKILATMSWDDIARSMVALGGSITILAIGLNAMKGTIVGSAAMLVAVAALTALTPVLVILGSLSWTSIAKGLVTIAGAFAIIGIAGALLKPVIAPILGLAAAMALIGVGVLAVGVGLVAFGAGLTSIVAGFTALASSIGVVAVGIVKVVESVIVGIIKGVGNGIVAFCEVISDSVGAIAKALKTVILSVCEVLVECVPVLADTLLKVVVGVIEALVTYTPQIVAGLFKFIIGVIKAISDYIPDFVKAIFDVVASIFTGVIEALKSVDPDALIKTILSVGLMAGVMAALAAVSGLIPAAMTGLLGVGLVIAELAVVLAAIGALAQIPGLTWLINEGGKLLEAIGTAIGGLIGGIIGGIAKGITSSLPEIGKDLSDFMTNIQPFIDGATRIDPSAMNGIKSLVGAILALTGANLLNSLTSWLTGGGSSIVEFGKDLAEFAPNFRKYADTISGVNAEAVTASANAAKALAEMTNNIPNSNGVVSWFAGDNSISKFATELITLGYGLKGFADQVAGINPEYIVATANAAKALSEMTNNIPNSNGVVSWFAGDNSISKFATDIITLGYGLKGFADQVAGINPDSVIAASNAAKALSEMTNNIPNSGGIVSWFAGENSISKFTQDIITLGYGLKGFSVQVAGINPENVTAAANAAKALAEMTNHIPNSGGVVSWFAGDNSLSKFATDIVSLGMGLKGFSTQVTGINPENVTAAANSAKALAEMTQHIPSEGGIKSWFTGNTSISSFADKLPALGKGLKGFSTSVEGINPENLSAAANAAKSIAQMTDSTLGEVDKIPTLATNLGKLGKGMKTCLSDIGGISPESMSATKTVADSIKKVLDIDSDKAQSVAKAINDMADAIKNLAKVPANSTESFNKALSQLGKTSVDSLIKAFKDAEPDMKSAGEASIESFINGAKSKSSAATKAIQAIVKACTDAIGDGKSAFRSAGSDLVDGFAAGISANDYKAAAKARAMAKAAAQAAKEALDINSPSKVFRAIGYSVPEGFAMGIDKLSGMATSSTTNMAVETINNVKRTISRISDAINSDIDAQPTIRPVLDLSAVRSGANSISGLFGRNSSIGVLTNVGAINSAMNRYNQNGESMKLASEIDKLNKNIKDMEHVTYNINGVTFSGGSDVEDAFRTILRASRIERRT